MLRMEGREIGFLLLMGTDSDLKEHVKILLLLFWVNTVCHSAPGSSSVLWVLLTSNVVGEHLGHKTPTSVGHALQGVSGEKSGSRVLTSNPCWASWAEFAEALRG